MGGAPTPREGKRRAPNISSAPTLEATVDDPVVLPLELPLISREHYEVYGEMARGGLGRILRATDRRLGRAVVLKELLDPAPGAKARFVREAQVTARLQHPAIVPLYEAGRWPSGEPFYAMKLVTGAPLDRLIAGTSTLHERLAYLGNVVTVAEAVAYAHKEGVIHRDLKPGNVIVGEFGETIVIDWGLAKMIGAPADDGDDPSDAGVTIERARSVDGPMLTMHGSVLGTPEFMPPEQARGERTDERADVYALGAILYNLLAGVSPYGGEEESALRRVLEGPPPPLPTREPRLPEELAAIVGKAMARDPAARYPSAKELARDLESFQRGQLVAAYRYSRRELVLRWVKKRAWLLGIAAAALIAIVVSSAVNVSRVVAERDRAERERREAVEARGRAQTAERAAVRRADELILLQAREALERDPTRALDMLKQLSPSWSDLGTVRELASEARWRGLGRVYPGHTADVYAVAFSADGKTAVSASGDRTLRVWNVAAGTSEVLRGHEDDVVAVAISPDGKTVASAGLDRSVRVWDVAKKTSLVVGRHDGIAIAVALSPGGTLVASGSEDKSCRIWRVSGGELARCNKNEGVVYGVGFTPDGTRVVSGGGGGTIDIAPVAGGPIRVLHASGPIAALSVSAGTERAVTAGNDYAVDAWDLQTGRARFVTRVAAQVNGVDISADGRRVAIAGSDKTALVIDLDSGERLTLRGHDLVLTAAFSLDGRWLATGSVDKTMRIWPLDTGEHVLDAGRARLRGVSVSSAGTIYACTPDGEITTWDASLRRRTRFLAGSDCSALAVSPGDDQLAVAGRGSVRLYPLPQADGARPSPTRSFAGPRDREPVYAVAYDSVGRRVAWGNPDGGVDILDRSDDSRRKLVGPRSPLYEVAFSPDGKKLAGASWAKLTLVWDLASPDGRAEELTGAGNWVQGVAFSPDGRSVASVARDQLVRVWDLDSRRARVLAGHTSFVDRAAFSPDGRRLASASTDRTVRVWDPATGELVSTRHLPEPPESVAWLRDGALVVGLEDGTVRVWRDDLPHDAAALAAWISAAPH
jgi:eukaryotic-like serine/threonine-protein kinase